MRKFILAVAVCAVAIGTRSELNRIERVEVVPWSMARMNSGKLGLCRVGCCPGFPRYVRGLGTGFACSDASLDTTFAHRGSNAPI